MHATRSEPSSQRHRHPSQSMSHGPRLASLGPHPPQVLPTNPNTKQWENTESRTNLTCNDTQQDRRDSPAAQHRCPLVNPEHHRAHRHHPAIPEGNAENLTCFLLGISGLTWDEQHLLAPIWNELYKQPNKSTRDIACQTFFEELSTQTPSFRKFSNTTLADNIVNHKLAPGPTFETCHHGISILAVSLCTFTVQEQERQDEACFELATNKTPDAIKKHLSKGPPPLPTTISELIQQIH